MIELQAAFKLLANSWDLPPLADTIPLSEALGRVLPAPVLSPIESPPFDKSAMDGYALPAGDVREAYRIVGTLAAGDAPTEPIEPGTCWKIMTGAPLPPGSDRVHRFEYAEEWGPEMHPIKPEPATNVIKRGENLKAGDVLLTPRRLKPADIGILAASGIEEVRVSARPRLRIITTGSEIVPPGTPLSPGKIYDSNGSQLAAQAADAGCAVSRSGIVPDDSAALMREISASLETQDILILSGGVSMGEFDFVPTVLREAGVEKIFHVIAVKPGKPVFFGKKGKCAVFGLPGNPVSTFVIFNIIVIPFIRQWQGLSMEPMSFPLPLAREAARKKDIDRTEFIPVTVTPDGVIPIRYHGSSHLNAYSEADGFIRISVGVERIEAGTVVDVMIPGCERNGIATTGDAGRTASTGAGGTTRPEGEKK